MQRMCPFTDVADAIASGYDDWPLSRIHRVMRQTGETRICNNSDVFYLFLVYSGFLKDAWSLPIRSVVAAEFRFGRRHSDSRWLRPHFPRGLGCYVFSVIADYLDSKTSPPSDPPGITSASWWTAGAIVEYEFTRVPHAAWLLDHTQVVEQEPHDQTNDLEGPNNLVAAKDTVFDVCANFLFEGPHGDSYVPFPRGVRVNGPSATNA
jgi:hypothetical protein